MKAPQHQPLPPSARLPVQRSALHLVLWHCAATLLLLGALAPAACGALTLTINEATANSFSFTLGGTFDADTIGDQRNYLALKPDWTTNNGVNVPWINEFAPGLLTVVQDTVAISGEDIVISSVATFGQYGDSVFWQTGDTIEAGRAVSGTFYVTGTNHFNYASLTAFQLVSGFDNTQIDWERLEATTAVPEPSTALFGVLGLAVFLLRHRTAK
jgi:hypothetical protein